MIAFTKFLGSQCDPVGFIPKASVNGVTLMLQGKDESNALSNFLWVEGWPHGLSYVKASFWFVVEREAMPTHRKVLLFKQFYPVLFAQGCIRLYARSSFWGDDDVSLRMWVRTRMFQPAGSDVTAVNFAKTWKKKGGKKYIHLGKGVLPSEPEFKVHTNKDLFLVREIEFKLDGCGKHSFHFGWPDVKKNLVMLGTSPPVFIYE